MTQPPGYPTQPGDPLGPPGQPPQPQPGQGWSAYGPPNDPNAAPTSGANPYPPSPGYPAQGYPAQGYPAPGYPDQGYPPQPYPGQPGQVSGMPYPGPVSSQPYPGQPTQPYPGQPGQAYPVSGQPFAGGGQTATFPADPYAPPGYQAGYQPDFLPQAPPPKKKRRGLLITMIVLAALLVVCGGGGVAGYFVLKGSGGKGQATPVDAVNEFLKAVYKDKDVTAANKFVCSSARNTSALTKRLDDIAAYDAKLKEPTYNWPAPTVDKQDKESATLTVPVKVTTSDDRVAEAKLKFLATKDNGWWVCEISAA